MKIQYMDLTTRKAGAKSQAHGIGERSWHAFKIGYHTKGGVSELSIFCTLDVISKVLHGSVLGPQLVILHISDQKPWGGLAVCKVAKKCFEVTQ